MLPSTPQLLLRPNNVVVASGDAAQTTAFLARTSGLNGTETAAYKALINGLVSDSIFSLLDALYIFATNTTTTANLNLISTSFGLTASGSPTFTADHGYTGDAVSAFLDTAYTPSTAALNYAQNSASFGAYVVASRTTAQNWSVMGTGTSSFDRAATYQPLNAIGPVALVNINEQNNVQPALGATQASGMGSVVRTGVSTTAFYKNAAAAVAGSATSIGLASNTFIILADRNNGSPSNFTSDQLSAAYIGGGMNATQIGNLHSRINAYMTALGVNAY